MKDTFYFQHDYNARNDERLLMLRAKYGIEAYGVFWMILESMAEASTGQINRVAIAGLSLGYGVAIERLTAIIDYCINVGLFKELQEGAIISTRMCSHLAFRESLRSAGRAGAAKRWPESHKNSHPNAKERKGKERKVNTKDTKELVVTKREEREVVASPDAPTPAQVVRDFFANEASRETIIQELVAKGFSEDDARREVKKFRSYWTERNKTGQKERWEMEKTFELRRRLVTWFSNFSKFSPHTV